MNKKIGFVFFGCRKINSEKQSKITATYLQNKSANP
jgi:hypothetical protein